MKRRWASLRTFVFERMVPMKRNERGEKVVDKSQVTWRSFQTVVSTFLTAAAGWLIAHTGNDTQLAERLERRMAVQDANIASLASSVSTLNVKVDFVMAFVNGMLKTPKI